MDFFVMSKEIQGFRTVDGVVFNWDGKIMKEQDWVKEDRKLRVVLTEEFDTF